MENITKMEKLPIISLEEVADHKCFSDCWIVICDRVYDITEFLYKHPGGESILLEEAGRDATFTFLAAGHNSTFLAALQTYLIGILPKCERLYENIIKIKK